MAQNGTSSGGEAVPETNESVISKRGSRTKARNFSSKEDEDLFSAWLIVCQNGSTPVQDSLEGFWERVHVQFELTHPNTIRTSTALRNRFRLLQSTLNKFSSAVDVVENRNPVGVSDAQRLQMAQEVYASVVGKPFHHIGVWKVVRDAPKWIESQRRSSILSQQTSSDESDQDEPGASAERTPGTRTRTLKKRKHKVSKTNEMIKQIVESQKRRAQLEQQYLEDQIMLQPTAGMDECSRRYFDMRRNEIIEKFGLRPTSIP